MPGGKVDILQLEMAFENNKYTPETFRSYCIVTRQKNAEKNYQSLRKEKKQSLLVKEHGEWAHKTIYPLIV